MNDFLDLIIQQGTSQIKAKIKSGEVKKEDVVKVEDELATAKKTIGSSGSVSDDDLRVAIVQISHSCGLRTDCDELNLVEKAHLEVVKRQGITGKDLILGGIKNDLVQLARKDVAKGKLSLDKPYNLKSNVARLTAAWKKNFITKRAIKLFGITDDDLVGVIKDALVEVGFKKIIE